jgi:hypothetical protein
MSAAIKLLSPSEKSEILKSLMNATEHLPCSDNFYKLVRYVDYLEGVARDYHLQGRLIAESMGGSVPERGVYTHGE